MLTHLYIRNFALIDVLDIDFYPGFSVITGETGAGKSIILGALGLLLGQRADSKSVKTGTQKCTIEAHFDISRYNLSQWFEDNDLDAIGEECSSAEPVECSSAEPVECSSAEPVECIIRRELTSAGKSRGFINDTPVQLSIMKELGEKLIDIHSQHQNLLLQKENFQLNVVDIIAGNDKVREAYVTAYNRYHKAKQDLDLLIKQIEESKDNEEFMRFQLEELLKANLRDGEQEELEQEQETASHTEEIKSLLFEADGMLNDDNQGIMPLLRQASQRLSSAAAIYPKMQELAERIESSYIELKDISQETSSEAENIDFDPERLAYINDRLDHIYTLQRKFNKSSVAELLAEQETLQTAIDSINGSDDSLKAKQAEVQTLLNDATNKAEKLSDTRRKVTKKIEKEMISRLEALGMPSVEFHIDIKDTTMTKDGKDSVEFLFSANKGMAMRPVAEVASGGEIARVMLSLKAMISGAVKLPTIIFDEIDTGVSGRVAEKMADIMHEMGKGSLTTDEDGERGRQVISITHLPQIASRGTHHYKVEKHDTPQGTTSILRLLTDDERITEVAQMLSGSAITEAAITNARELLKNSK